MQKQNTCNLMEIKMAAVMFLACLVMSQSTNMITYNYALVGCITSMW